MKVNHQRGFVAPRDSAHSRLYGRKDLNRQTTRGRRAAERKAISRFTFGEESPVIPMDREFSNPYNWD